MPAQWQIKYWPRCENLAFLSHCAEDRDRLVLPVFNELGLRQIAPWVDHHHYPSGRDAIEALQDELLKCRHVVYFITPAMLRQGRGWTGAERTLAAEIQQFLRHGREVVHVELPLMFVEPTDVVFQRSLWRSLVDKSVCCPYPAMQAVGAIDDGRRDWDGKHVSWAVDQIQRFVNREESWAIDLGAQDPKMLAPFEYDQNLMRRILAQTPQRLFIP